MSVIIGSARIDERGKITGGSAGDQKQSSKPDYKGQVSMQKFYVHAKGWYVMRPKNVTYANKIAERMIALCNNPNYGYDQGGRLGVINNGIDAKVKSECDCSSSVRACVKEATGKDPGNFTTDNEVSYLAKTGLFEEKKSYTSGMKLYPGDILVTKTKGHTVIVCYSDYSRGSSSSSSGSSSKVGKNISSTSTKDIQIMLNKVGGYGLTTDGVYGEKTTAAVKDFQKKNGLTQDGVVGNNTITALKKKYNGSSTVKKGKVSVSTTLNVRKGAGTNYSKIGNLTNGTTVEIQKTVTGSDGAKWYYIKYSGSKYGYVKATYIKLV